MQRLTGKTTMSASHTQRQDLAEDEDGVDKRLHRRIPVSLRARYLGPDGEERSCTVVNISAGGLRLISDHPAQSEDKVVLYVESVGRFDCTVVRPTKDGFAVKFDIHAKKRERTVEALSRLLLEGPTAKQSPEQRMQPRVAAEAKAELILGDGSTVACKVIDISLTGASVEMKEPLAIGAIVKLGRMKAKVARHHETGVGLMFLREAGDSSPRGMNEIEKSVSN